MATNLIKFPLDLDENPENHHYMVFRIYSNSSASLSGSKKSSGISSRPNAEDALLSKLDNTRGQQPEYKGAAEQSNDNLLEEVGGAFGSAGEAAKEGVKSVFSDTTYSPAKKINQDAIYLPFPQTINMSDGWDWESVSFQSSALGELLKGNVDEAATKAVSGVMGSVSKLAGNENADRLIMHKQRKAANPRKESLFNEPDMRTFSFEFDFAPRNQKETDTAQQIIQLFKYHASPELYDGDNALYNYPSEFQIYFVSNGKENKYIGKIDRCAMTSCSVNYTGANIWSAFSENGAPTHLKLTVELTELSLQSRNNLKRMDGE